MPLPGKPQTNKEEYKGILVYVEHSEGRVAPVTLELIGKARELTAGGGVLPLYRRGHCKHRRGPSRLRRREVIHL